MQLNSVYLYPNKVDVFTNLGTWKTERYRRVYNRNLKIYRSVDNRIDFQVRNSDEKATSVENYYIVFKLVSVDTQELILEQDCTVQSASTGKVYVTLTENQVRDLDLGFYSYSLTQESRTYIDTTNYTVSSKSPLYVDAQYEVSGLIEVNGDLNGNLLSSTVINKFDYVNPATTGYNDPSYYISSIINANPETTTGNSLHTFQLYMNNYTGTVTVQGSLSEGGVPHVWSDVSVKSYNESNLEYINVTGKWNWLRIKHQPTSPNTIASFTIQQTILGNYVVNIGNRGKSYSIGQVLTILGSNLGGESPANDLNITVTATNSLGGITGITYAGVSYNGVKTYTLSPNQNINSGTLDKILYR